MQSEAQKRYEREKQMKLSIKLNKNKDSELMDYIAVHVPNVNAWAKELMYNDMTKENR